MAGVGSDLAGMVNASQGSTNTPNNAGRNATPGSGVKGGVQKPPQPGASPLQQAQQTRQTPVRGPRRPPPPQQHQPQFSANNPMVMTQPPPVPHPGLRPPYPDARSPQPTMLPNGQVMMPAPPSPMMGPMQPRVPQTFTPGMTGLLGMR